VVGYYNRFDVFDVSVNRTRLTPATFHDDVRAAPSAESTPQLPPADPAIRASSTASVVPRGEEARQRRLEP
jgi:aliphatic nitrilase